MKKQVIAFALVLSVILSFAGCVLPGNISEDVEHAWNTVKDKASEIFFTTKNAAEKAYGTAKDKAVYVYDSASDWVSDTYSSASDKVSELIGDGKEFIEGLTDIDDIVIPDVEDYAPYATAKSELFVPYYISSLLSERGYTVYNGGAYYKDHMYGGLIFTKGDVFIQEDGQTIYSCGFLQLVSNTYSDARVTEKMVETGLIAVSTATEEEESKAFVVQDHVQLSDFGGIIDDTYFTIRQTDDYVVEIQFQENTPSAYDSTIELYDFDAEKAIYPAAAPSDIENLYENQHEVFVAASDAANSVADYIEHTGAEVSSLLVLDNGVLDGLCEKASKGYSAVTGYATRLLSNVKIGDSQLVRLDAAGRAHLMNSENPFDAERMTNGLVCALGSGMTTAMKAVGTVVTVAFCVKNGVLVVPVIIVTTGACSIVYNVSNMLEGLQDVYYGAKGDASEAENPVLALFKKAIGNDKVATLVYHIWGISTTIVAGLMNPVARTLQIAKTAGLNVFRTAGRVTRAVLVELAKLTATGVASGLVNKYIGKVVKKVTGSDALSILVGFGSASVASYLVYTGLNQFDKQCNLSGIYPKDFIEGADGNRYFYDDNGNEYKIDKELVKDTKFVKDGVEFTTDRQGRKVLVKCWLKENTGARKPIRSTLHDIGKGDERSGDDRGHILGRNLGGSDEIENMIPMNAKLNRGEYRQLEMELAQQRAAGKRVYIEISLNYEGSSSRPSSITYKYTIDGETGIRFFNNN